MKLLKKILTGNSASIFPWLLLFFLVAEIEKKGVVVPFKFLLFIKGRAHESHELWLVISLQVLEHQWTAHWSGTGNALGLVNRRDKVSSVNQ